MKRFLLSIGIVALLACSAMASVTVGDATVDSTKTRIEIIIAVVGTGETQTATVTIPSTAGDPLSFCAYEMTTIPGAAGAAPTGTYNVYLYKTISSRSVDMLQGYGASRSTSTVETVNPPCGPVNGSMTLSVGDIGLAKTAIIVLTFMR